MELHNYEAAVIFTPVLSETQLKEAVKSYREFIPAANGKIVNEEAWGLTKLAYSIDKKSSGFYHFLEFTAPGDLIAKMDVIFKRDERVLCYMNLRLDKHAIAYNEKRKSGAFKKKTKAVTTEATS